MNRFHKTCASALALSLLAACGGGGGDDNDNDALAASSYSESDIRAIAGSGLSIVSDLGSSTGLQAVEFLAGFLQGLSADASGTRTGDLRTMCTTGTGSVSITKAAARTGFAAGDQVNLTFDKCAAAGTVISGAARMTVRTAVTARPVGNVDVSFEARATAFSYTEDGFTITHDGVAEIKTTLSASNLISTGVTVPTGQQWSVNVNGPVAATNMLSANAALVSTRSGTPNNATLKFDGTVTSGISGSTDTQQYQITTPTPLSGTLDSNGLLIPSAGQLTTKPVDANVNTSTTLNGATATVSGDTDSNGSLDLTFTSTWAALVAD